MKIDQLYMENLAEYVFDEKKFVTYKFLSVKLGVHVNLAKQMLYHFYETEKAKGSKIYATYYLSGVTSQKWISRLTSARKDDSQSSSEELLSQNSSASKTSKDDKDVLLVLLCKDHELEDMKLKFSKLYSVHVYALSSSPSENFDVLTRITQNPLRDDEGNGPIHYGGMTCKAAFELLEDPRLAPLLKNVEEVKANLKKVKEKHEKAASPAKKPEKSHSPPPSKISKTGNTTTSKKGNASNGTGDNRLKSMFASASSKPVSTKPKEVVPLKNKISDREEKSAKSSYGKNKNKKNQKESSKSKEISNRKRKRVRDSVFSSSDDDADSVKISEDEDEDSDALSESPIPRKRIQIESDSDDDFKEEAPKKVVPPPVEEKSASGKRRVCKTVPKRHVDNDGYLVTVMEQVMVSESDPSDDEKDKSAKPDAGAAKLQNKPSVSSKGDKIPPVASTTKDKKDSKKTTSSSTTTAAAKTKQASIMSFFQKK